MVAAVCWSVLLTAAFVVVYPYLIYPLLLRILAKLHPRPWQTGDIVPKLSVIVAAHNEERIIADKIRNCLQLDYPREQLEILVASDGSTDGTDAIVRAHAPAVALARLEPRGGKQAALNHAVAAATGEILLFTDASVRTRPELARRVVRAFADPRVGAVSTTIRIVPRLADEAFPTAPDDSANAAVEAESAYLDLDLETRRLESLIGSAVGCCGSCYAVRRACFAPFDPGACNDFASALDAVQMGYRVVFDDEAVGYMLAAKHGSGEFKRKVRTIAGGMDTLWLSGAWKGVLARPVFWWQLLSHKLLRWLGPPALLVGWVAAICGGLAGDWRLGLLAALGCAGVAFGLVGIAWSRRRRPPSPLRMAAFALISIIAAIAAWHAFLTGRRQIVWQPTVR